MKPTGSGSGFHVPGLHVPGFHGRLALWLLARLAHRNDYIVRAVPYGRPHADWRRLDCDACVWLGSAFRTTTVRFPGRP